MRRCQPSPRTCKNPRPEHPELHPQLLGEASEGTRGTRQHLLCAESEPKGEEDPLQVSPVQVATPVGIEEDESKKTVQREHSRGVQLLGLQGKQG